MTTPDIELTEPGLRYPDNTPGRVITDRLTSIAIHRYVKSGVLQPATGKPGAGNRYAWTYADVDDLDLALRVRELVSGDHGKPWQDLAIRMLECWRAYGRGEGWLAAWSDGTVEFIPADGNGLTEAFETMQTTGYAVVIVWSG